MTFELTEQQANYVCFALAQRPYSEVVELLGIIQRQAQAQQAAAAERAACARTAPGELLIAEMQRQLARQSGQARPQPVDEAPALRQ